MGIILGIMNLKDIFDDKYYKHLDGGILEGIGKMFNQDLKVYVYPYNNKVKDQKIMTIKNIEIDSKIKPLYDFYVSNKRLIDIKGYREEFLNIFSNKVLTMIKSNKKGWEDLVPTYVDNIIKENKLFGYNKNGLNKKN